MRYESFMVHFANGQGDGTFSSLDEAGRVMGRRAEYDPPPPGIFPAEIWQRTFVDRGHVDERLVERGCPARRGFSAAVPV
jgi:hypothetical protein